MRTATLDRVARRIGVALAVFASATVAQAQGSSVQVRVIDRTARPVAEAQVAIAGSLIGGLTKPGGGLRATLDGYDGALPGKISEGD